MGACVMMSELFVCDNDFYPLNLEWGSENLVLFLHHRLAQSHNKVSCETFDNHMVGAAYVHCTPENNILALGTHGGPGGPGHIGICTPGNQQLCCCQIARQGGNPQKMHSAHPILTGAPCQLARPSKKTNSNFLQVVILLGTTAWYKKPSCSESVSDDGETRFTGGDTKGNACCSTTALFVFWISSGHGSPLFLCSTTTLRRRKPLTGPIDNNCGPQDWAREDNLGSPISRV